MVKIKRFLLIIGIHWVLVLPFWTLCRILILNFYSDSKLGVHLDPVPILHRFHQCSGCTRDIWVRKSYHSTCFVLWMECKWYHSQSPSDPSVFIVGAILQSEDFQPEQQSAHHNDHWRSHDQLLSISGGYLHTDDTRFDRLMFVFKDLEGNIMQLNGLFEWPASRLRGLRGNFGWKRPKRRSYSRVTFANTKLLAMQIVIISKYIQSVQFYSLLLYRSFIIVLNFPCNNCFWLFLTLFYKCEQWFF